MWALGRCDAAAIMHHFVCSTLAGGDAGLEAVGGEIAKWCVEVLARPWTHWSALIEHEPFVLRTLKGCKNWQCMS